MTYELEITRVIDAPLKVVYDAFTTTQALEAWWGPKEAAITVKSLDLTPGGLFHYYMNNEDGTKAWGRFKYEEVVPYEKIVFVNSFSNEEGEIVPNPWGMVFPLEIHNTLTFNDKGEQTELVLRGRAINASEAEQKGFEDLESSMRQGFEGTFAQLDEYVAQQK